MHHTIGGGPAILGRPLEAVVKLLSAPTYASVRFVTQLVGAGLDVILSQFEPVLGGPAMLRGELVPSGDVQRGQLPLTVSPR